MMIDCFFMFQNDFKVFIPELYLITIFGFLLIYGVIYSPSIYHGSNILTREINWLIVYTLTLTFLLLLSNPFTNWILFNNLLIIDNFNNTIKLILIATTVIAIIISFNYINYEKLNSFEYNLLVLLATFGMLLLVCSYDLIALYLAIELQSLTLYILATLKRNSEFSTEAGLKYFILGAFSSGLLLFGCSMLYGFTGVTNFEDLTKIFTNLGILNNSTLYNYPVDINVLSNSSITTSGILVGVTFILVAFLFKLTVVPFHMWAPDVYEGSPTPVTAFFSITPKIALLAIFLRLFFMTFYDLIQPWQQILIFCAAFTIILATFAALYQKKLKRLLIFSSIGHVGFMLIAFSTGTIQGVQALLIYILIYIVMTINFFTVILSLRDSENLFKLKYISNLKILSKTNPVLALTLTLTLFSMAGIPPLAGFCSKLYVFFAAIDAQLYLLALIGVLMSVIGCFYYIRIIKTMYFDKVEKRVSFKIIDKSHSIILGVTSLYILIFFMIPSSLLLYTHNLVLTLSL